MRIRRAGVCAFLLLIASACYAQQLAGSKISETLRPLRPDEIAIYRAVLDQWREGENITVHLAEVTNPLTKDDASSVQECGRGFKLDRAPIGLVHRFTLEDVEKLGPKGTVILVNAEQGGQEVEKNDPRQGITQGKTIDDAVRNGFAHGLFTLSEIVFDRGHAHAVVTYGFVCGWLCGHGNTLLMELKNGKWTRAKRMCGGWVS